MSQDSNLHFSIEESIWFQKGQEVSELISISLDPDISIQELDQFISLRGVLHLAGEYRVSEEYEEPEDIFEFANVRYVNEITTREDGINVINHQFPVDITIPKNRIANLEEVFVSIESFDYEIPQPRCIELVADLSIRGIDNEAGEVEEVKEEETYEALFRGPTLTEFEEKIDKDEKDDLYLQQRFEEEQEFDKESNPDLFSPFSVEVRKEQVTEVSEQKTDVEDEDEHEEDEAKITTENVPEFETETVDANIDVNYSAQKEEPQIVSLSNIVRVDEEDDSVQDMIEVTYSAKQDTKQKETKAEQVSTEAKRENDNSLYLTKLFTKEEEEFSRLKICIVQKGENLDLISERYDVSIQQLLKINHLGADQDVYEGQIIHIPAYVNAK